MAINVCGRADIRMTEPFLYFFQPATVIDKQARAAMTKFVESDLPESGFLQVLTKMICNEVRRVWNAKLIDIYILTFVITVSAEFSVGLLLLFHLKQYLFELRH